MGKPLNETRRHQAAFEYYYSMGEGRSLAEVARRFGVSPTAAAGWSSAFSWGRRIAERDEIVSRFAAERAIKDAAEARAFQMKLARATQARWAQTLASGGAAVTASDFVKAAQHELLLLGKATSRSEIVSSGASNAAAAAILAAIDRVCPERCPKCGEALGVKAALASALAQAIESMSSSSPPATEG